MHCTNWRPLFILVIEKTKFYNETDESGNTKCDSVELIEGFILVTEPLLVPWVMVCDVSVDNKINNSSNCEQQTYRS